MENLTSKLASANLATAP
ncbi:unnamed protein product, partial [Rotaria sp. Silwood2]